MSEGQPPLLPTSWTAVRQHLPSGRVSGLKVALVLYSVEVFVSGLE